MKTKQVVINDKYGGFGLSELAYEKLIEWGIPVQKYIEQKRDPETRLYLKEPKNEGKVIFDRGLETDKMSVSMTSLMGRYWDTWTDKNREHPLLIKVVKKLGRRASSRYSKLKIVKIPANVDYKIDEYDGWESIHETHRSWN